MKLKTFIGIFCLTATLAWADTSFTQTVGPFGGLNTNVSQEALDSNQSPDLLNVDITQGGKSVKKRQGYGIDATLSVSTSGVHNLYKFFDSSGNEVRLAFNDNRVSSSINGATWSTIITTGSVGATWDCTDYLGFAYCASSSNDNPIKTNGTIAGTTGVGGTNGVPAGSLISNTGDRLLVGATAANPSRLYYSQSSVFTNFTLGIQSSDSSFEDIVAPGSKLTHLAYRFGRWLWWKDQSFGFIIGTGQFDLQIVTVSNTIGTLDNTDVFDGGYVYFRGSDSQIYTYDGSTLSRAISTDISPTLRAINRRKADSWSQSTQVEFQTGSIYPVGSLSTTISPGDVVPSTYTIIENSSTTFALGSVSNVLVGTRTIVLATNNSGTINDNGFEGAFSSNYTNDVSTGNIWAIRSTSGGIVPHGGSTFLNLESGDPQGNLSVSVLDAATNAVLATDSAACSNDTTWRQRTLTDASDAGKRVIFKFCCPVYGNRCAKTNSSYLFGGAITYWQACKNAGIISYAFDDVTTGSSTINSGWYLSKAYDTGYTSTTIQITNVDYGTTSSVPTFSIQSSTASNGLWSTIATSSGTNGIANRFVRYTTTITISGSDSYLPTISTVTLNGVSSGTYYSAVNNAPSLTAWNTLGVTDIAGSSITYYTRSSTNSFSILSSTPSWIPQPKNATVSASTGTYFQLRADFSLSSATAPPTLNDFTFNWYEGAASDKMYATYFSNGLWFSVSIGTSTSTNNRIFRYDLVSNLWTLYDIPSNGFAIYNNGLYFADPNAGKVYQFGNSVTSDNGAAINSYWKSKAFFGDSPFNDKDLRLASWYIAESSGTTLNLTYTLDESTTVVSTINLFDSRRNVIQNNRNFPLGSIGTNFNVQFGDNSTNPPWEVFGGEILGVSRPWKVYP